MWLYDIDDESDIYIFCAILAQRKCHAIIENVLKSEAAFLTSLKVAEQVRNAFSKSVDQIYQIIPRKIYGLYELHLISILFF